MPKKNRRGGANNPRNAGAAKPKNDEAEGASGGEQFPSLGEGPSTSAATSAPPQVVRLPPQAAAAPPSVGPKGDSVKELEVALQGMFVAEDVLKRPPAGAAGKKIELVTNMFGVVFPVTKIFHYDVQIDSISERMGDEGIPIQKRSRCAATVVNRIVIDRMATQYARSDLGNCHLAFDGRKNVYAKKRLPLTNSELAVKVVIEGEERDFKVTIKFANEVQVDSVNAMYRQQVRPELFKDVVLATDIILRTQPTLQYIPVGRSIFELPPNGGTGPDLSGGLHALFGYYCSIRLGAWKPMVNIDMTATAFYKAEPLISLVQQILKRDNLITGLNDMDRARVAREITKLKVSLTHLPDRGLVRIEGLSRRGASQETFQYENRTITVAEYYYSKYRMRLQYPTLPCVQGRRGAFYPMELCLIAPGQHSRKKLTDIQTSTMIRQTAIAPKQRFERIRESARKLALTSRPYLNEFGMQLDVTPVEVTARVLDSPEALFINKKTVRPANGVWKIEKFIKPTSMTKWAIVSDDRCRNRDGMAKTLMEQAKVLGMQVAPPLHVPLPQVRDNLERAILENVKQRMPDVQMTVVVLNNRIRYGLLKHEAEVSDLSMTTQCVKDINVDRKFNSMFADNLLQKMNTKLGGQNSALGEGRPAQLKSPFMVVGAHLHSTLGNPSIAALVASKDPVPAQYHCVTKVQKSRADSQGDESIQDVKQMMVECIKTFYDNCRQTLPNRIFYYRDAVSEGQFDKVRTYEFGSIRAACQEFRAGWTPKVCFIFVHKRHHVRFMPKIASEGKGKSGNIPAGTLVDTKIVNPTYFDFYLCSHEGIQGTSRAAHYHVVHDDGNHSPDDIYKITYALCHVYARCTRSVSLPAPAYYAVLATKRAMEYIKHIVFENAGVASGISGRSGEQDANQLVVSFREAQKVHESLKGRMYFV